MSHVRCVTRTNFREVCWDQSQVNAGTEGQVGNVDMPGDIDKLAGVLGEASLGVGSCHFQEDTTINHDGHL